MLAVNTNVLKLWAGASLWQAVGGKAQTLGEVSINMADYLDVH